MPTYRRAGSVIEIECASAAEFVAVLDPLLGPFAQPAHLTMYIFRGMASARHALLPSAYRPQSTIYHGAEWVHPPLITIGDQCESEIDTLQKFFEIAARHGVRLPEDSQLLRSELDSWGGRLFRAEPTNPVFWPPSNLLSLIALAQHYGVPTRALDWTWSALTAAYFAVSEAVSADDHLVVWIFSYLAEMLERIASLTPGKPRPLILFTAPGAENDNLQAQRGLFMAQAHRIEDKTEPFEARSYDDLFDALVPPSRRLPTAYRVLVRSSEGPEIRWLLSSAGVTDGSLFPGLWGVAREFKEERLVARLNAGTTLTPFASQVQHDIVRTFQSGGA